MMKIVRAKLHGIRVTAADLNYHGSITLDPEQCDLVGLYPLEYVEIWNKTNGARISTYVIHGEPGSKCCILNGAAARTCQPSDEMIIASSDYIEPTQLYDIKPRILTFLPNNEVDQVLEYVVYASDDRAFDFKIVDVDKQTIEDCHTYPNVDIAAIRENLANKGWNDEEIEAFVNTHFTL
jgi:aspartate 1-decarboxylase